MASYQDKSMINCNNFTKVKIVISESFNCISLHGFLHGGEFAETRIDRQITLLSNIFAQLVVNLILMFMLGLQHNDMHTNNIQI